MIKLEFGTIKTKVSILYDGSEYFLNTTGWGECDTIDLRDELDLRPKDEFSFDYDITQRMTSITCYHPDLDKGIKILYSRFVDEIEKIKKNTKKYDK